VKPFDLSVYLVTDTRLCGARGVAETVRLAVTGGATLVQLRDPAAPIREILALAETLVAMLRPLGVPLLVNDRVDVAMAAGADGVHLGQTDMPASAARRLMGEDAIIGLSVGNPAEFAAARDDLHAVDYLGTGPFRATATKDDAGAAIGPAGIATVTALCRLPVVAIGGIDATCAGEAIRAGADGVAAVSAICAAGDPEAATRAIADAVRTARAAVHPAPTPD
jgi:thiamine-phosphate pyrophosphorylase